MMNRLLLLLPLLFPASDGVQAANDRRTLSSAQLEGARASDQLLIRGTNSGNQSTVLVVRIDDSYRPKYAQRINIERVVPPGDFTLSLSLGGLKKPDGKPLALDHLRQAIIFAGESGSALKLRSVAIERGYRLPAQAIGWDLGADDSALWPGFRLLSPDNPMLQGAAIQAIHRGGRQQAAEALTTDGLRGIEKLHLPLPAGDWEITLWIHDRGEWEYLPHPLQRKITANGKTVFQEQFSPQSWIEQRYLKGLQHEYHPGDSVWQRYGEQPEGRISFTANAGDDGLTLRFSGHMPEAGFLSGLLVEPDKGYEARTLVENARQRWWSQNWPIAPTASHAAAAEGLHGIRTAIKLARGTTGSLELRFHAPARNDKPTVELQIPTRGRQNLKTTLRWGRWQLRRTRLSSTLLEPVDRHLRTGPTVPKSNGLPRRLHIEVQAPEGIPGGRYQGRLSIRLGKRVWHHVLTVEVPDVDLPQAEQPIGVYLERPPQLTWFKALTDERLQALRCDLQYLRQMGLTGISPGLTTPANKADQQQMLGELALVENAGFRQPILAYAPFKRVAQRLGIEQAVLRLKATNKSLANQTSELAWSIADEPSNPGRPGRVSEISRYARSYAPEAILAGHLNDPADKRFIRQLDLVLLNAGIGVDKDDITQAKALGARAWFYNMESPRAAAGFYLWKTGAQGYLQWHARMPTAAPFDPTDGREDDVQYLYPGVEACPQAPDVDSRLFDIVEGINDLRWMLWLEQQAAQSKQALLLLQDMQARIPDRWQQMLSIDNAMLDAWRAKVIALAR